MWCLLETSATTYHDGAPDKDPKQDITCVCTSLQIAFKISRILQAIWRLSLGVLEHLDHVTPAGKLGMPSVKLGGRRMTAYNVCYGHQEAGTGESPQFLP